MKKNTVLLSVTGSAVLFLAAACNTYAPAQNGGNTLPPPANEPRAAAMAPQMQPQPVLQFVRSSKYSFGSLKAFVNADIFTLDRAVRSTCTRAKLIELHRITRSNEVLYTYRDIQNVRLTIKVRELDNAQTFIVIKVDKFGNQINSEQLLAAIDDDLKAINQPAQ